jgi:hypothetical protein
VRTSRPQQCPKLRTRWPIAPSLHNPNRHFRPAIQKWYKTVRFYSKTVRPRQRKKSATSCRASELLFRSADVSSAATPKAPNALAHCTQPPQLQPTFPLCQSRMVQNGTILLQNGTPPTARYPYAPAQQCLLLPAALQAATKGNDSSSLVAKDEDLSIINAFVLAIPANTAKLKTIPIASPQ